MVSLLFTGATTEAYKGTLFNSIGRRNSSYKGTLFNSIGRRNVEVLKKNLQKD